MEKIVIIGIDQGIANCGYGVLQFKRKKGKIIFDKILESGVFTTSSKNDLGKRLVFLHSEILHLIDRYNADIIACEKLFYNEPGQSHRNKSASIIYTSMASGLVVLCSGERKLRFQDFVPGTIKKAVTGNGNASKEEVIEAIPKVLSIDKDIIKVEHQADALAIAYTAGINFDEEIEE